jgi:hypothetical protein
MSAPMPPEGQSDPFALIAHVKQRAFLKALVELGRHTHACRVAQIAHSHPWYWRRTDPGFAAWERRAWALWVHRVTAARTSVQRARGVRASARDRD